MEVEEVTEETFEVEERLAELLNDFRDLNQGAEVTEIQVLEPHRDRADETTRDQKVEVRIDREVPTKKKSFLEEEILDLLVRYQRKTGFRVTDVILDVDSVEVRIDALAYPQRLRKAKRRELEEGIGALLRDFTSRTEVWVQEILLQEDDEVPDHYKVRVRLAPEEEEKEEKEKEKEKKEENEA